MHYSKSFGQEFSEVVGYLLDSYLKVMAQQGFGLDNNVAVVVITLSVVLVLLTSRRCLSAEYCCPGTWRGYKGRRN